MSTRFYTILHQILNPTDQFRRFSLSLGSQSTRFGSLAFVGLSPFFSSVDVVLSSIVGDGDDCGGCWFSSRERLDGAGENIMSSISGGVLGNSPCFGLLLPGEVERM